VVCAAVLAKGEGAGATTLPAPVSGVALNACRAARAVAKCEADEEVPVSSRETVDMGACLRCCGDADMVQAFVKVERIDNLW
jgi:hypothetical protein